MSKAICVHQCGGPGVLRWEEVTVGAPGPGEIKIRHTFVGVNFIDVYHRTGVYKLPSFPFTPGQEAAGVVVGAGPGVGDLAVGDRVAYASAPTGAYAEERLMPADRVVRIPDGIEDRQAAAMMLKGMTAQYLLFQTVALQPGETIMFHAAAGGVGSIACQWARRLGVTVIGTVGSESKAALARANGCNHVIDYSKESIPERIRAITAGIGVRVVFDGVGKDTFAASLDCLQPRGLLVSFGQSSGLVPPLDITTLSAKGSLYLTRPTLMTYTAAREQLRSTAAALFAAVRDGHVRVSVPQEFPLREAAAAHAALEGRRTTGSTVLVV